MTSNDLTAAGTSTFSIPNVAEEVEIVVDDDDDENIDVQGFRQLATPPNLSQLQFGCHEQLDDEQIRRSDLTDALDHDQDAIQGATFKRPTHRLKTELEPEDVRLVNGEQDTTPSIVRLAAVEMGQQSADQLMEYLRRIKDMSCALGQAQEDQSVRGKFLGIFK